MRTSPVTSRGQPWDLAYTYATGTSSSATPTLIFNGPGVLHSIGWQATGNTGQIRVLDGATTMIGLVIDAVTVLVYYRKLDMQFLTSLQISNGGTGSTVNFWCSYRANTILGPGLT